MYDARDDKKLYRLRKLVLDYSYPERVDEKMVVELHNLLEWAVSKYLRRGLSIEEVRELLGEPHVKIGETTDAISDWLYPCAKPMNEIESLAMGEKWYWDLKFIDQKLSVFEKRKWRLMA